MKQSTVIVPIIIVSTAEKLNARTGVMSFLPDLVSSPTTTCPMSHAVKMSDAIHNNVIVVVYSRFLREEGENVRIDSI